MHVSYLLSSYHQGKCAHDEDDGHEDQQDEMLHLLRHGHHPAFAVGSRVRHHRAAVPLPTLVHSEQLVNHKTVASHDSQNQHQHNSGIQGGVHLLLTFRRVHVNEAPCAGAVLYNLPKSRKREETE